MKRNNRGLSEIVSTILILVIVFIAIGLVWAIIRGINPQGLECKADCIGTQLSFTGDGVKCALNDTAKGPVYGSVERASDDLEGLKMIVVVGGNSSYLTDAPGILAPKSFSKLDDTATDSLLKKGAGTKVLVKLAPVVNCKGKDQNCDAQESIEVTCSGCSVDDNCPDTATTRCCTAAKVTDSKCTATQRDTCQAAD